MSKSEHKRLREMLTEEAKQPGAARTALLLLDQIEAARHALDLSRTRESHLVALLERCRGRMMARIYDKQLFDDIDNALASRGGDLRCTVTGNPCGDTWAVGHDCKCAPCQAWLAGECR